MVILQLEVKCGDQGDTVNVKDTSHMHNLAFVCVRADTGTLSHAVHIFKFRGL